MKLTNANISRVLRARGFPRSTVLAAKSGEPEKRSIGALLESVPKGEQYPVLRVHWSCGWLDQDSRTSPETRHVRQIDALKHLQKALEVRFGVDLMLPSYSDPYLEVREKDS
jgi:hypothetical protein